MNREENWKSELSKAYPRLFRAAAGVPERSEGYPECEAGWEDLIRRACERIEKALSETDRFKVNQIKEKFGSLRFC